MTTFMDYKDYRIDYENNKFKEYSSFGSSKENYLSGLSASNSFYEKSRINKEIRNHDREKAKQKGYKNELANSDQQIMEQNIKREKQEQEETFSPR